MGFKSVDEIEKFKFDDCRITSFKVEDGCVRLELEALIVKSNNSQNTNFTESYAGTVTARFVGGEILSGVKDGFKLYDADEKLIKEVGDEAISADELRMFPKQCEGAYLYAFDKAVEDDSNPKQSIVADSTENENTAGKKHYILNIEFEDEEESAMGDSYRLEIAFDKAVFEWEHYMNRVQN